MTGVPRPRPVSVRGTITLGQLLKLCGAVMSGGEAKALIGAGEVSVNGLVEQRRGHHLQPGDVVEVGGQAYRVAEDE